jgi:hypothetical protein
MYSAFFLRIQPFGLDAPVLRILEAALLSLLTIFVMLILTANVVRNEPTQSQIGENSNANHWKTRYPRPVIRQVDTGFL